MMFDLVKRSAVVLAMALAAVTAAVAPAQAVSAYSGGHPYNSGCAGNGSQWASSPVAVYDGSTLVGYGYLRYSGGCQANWSEFQYANSTAYNNYTVGPSAWENGTTGTDQYSPNLAANPVYSRMVDGRSTACAGAQIYRYPSGQHVTWAFFACA